MKKPLVSVVITTKNEERNIENCLDSIKFQTYSHIETVVVDNDSSDKTKEIALKYTDKVYDKGPERSAQRNYGMINKSEGKYVMYVDADMILSPRLINDAVHFMEKNTKVLALHISEIILGKKYFSKVRRFERSFYDGTVIDGARFFRKKEFVEVRGFDESMSGPEDWDIDKKIKKIGKIALLPKEEKIKNWGMADFIKEKGVNPCRYGSVIYHNEAEFVLGDYLKKKGYYTKSFDTYINKWGKKDKDIKRQLGLCYRFFGVFLEKGKWVKLLFHPRLTFGMYFLRFMVGLKYIKRRKMSLDKYSKKYIHYYTDKIPSLLKNIFKNNNTKNIADLGSGDGPNLYALFKNDYLNNCEKVFAVDISPDRIANAKKIDNKITGIVSDVCDLSMIEKSSIDLAISTQVIEHVPDEEKFIKEVSRILSSSGLFYLSTVFKKWYGWYFYRCNGKWVLDPTHIREYTNDGQLLDILIKNNFEILKNKKTLQWFAVTDFILKRIGFGRDIYRNKLMKYLRYIQIPIFGYYNWELVLRNNDI